MQAVHGQSVQVSAAEEGQGFLFNSDGLCYLLTAAHVTNGRPRAQIVTAEGKSGSATMLRPFWEGFDLDIGLVRQIAAEDCNVGFERLARGADISLAGARVILPLIGPGGIDNLELDVRSTDYLEFGAAFSDPELAGKKGMSGSFALLNGQPVGLARATTPEGEIRFIQMAEITMNVQRWLSRAVRNPVDAAGAGGEGEGGSQPGLPYEVVSSGPAAIDSSHMIEAMIEGSAPFAYPAGKKAEIVLRNLKDGQKVISRLRIVSQIDEDYSQPAEYRIDLLPQEGSDRLQFWKAGTFPPDGVYDSGLVAPRFAAQIKITLIGATGSAPVRIDQIILD